MRVESAANEPTRRSKHDHPEFGLINHLRWLIYFNAWFGRNDGSQVVQEEIPRYKVTVLKSQMKLKKKISLSTFLPYSSIAVFTDKKTHDQSAGGVEYSQCFSADG